MTPSRHDHSRGTLYMLGVVLLWGCFLPVGKSALAVLDPYWISSLRFSAAAVAFIVMLALQEGWRKLHPEGRFWQVLGLGTLGFAGFGICLFEGLRHTRPEVASMILALGPVETALYQWWHTRRRPDGFTLAAICVALVGELLVLTAGDITRLTGGDAFGNFLIFLASLFWTTYTIGGQRMSGWSPVRYSALSCSLGWLVLFAATLLATALGHSTPPDPAKLVDYWPQISFIVIAVSVGGILLWNMAVARIGPLGAALFANFVPVVTYLIALGQGRVPAAVELLGAGIVIASLLANSRHQARRVRAAAG